MLDEDELSRRVLRRAVELQEQDLAILEAAASEVGVPPDYVRRAYAEIADKPDPHTTSAAAPERALLLTLFFCGVVVAGAPTPAMWLDLLPHSVGALVALSVISELRRLRVTD